jgi:hypothetical protein
MPTIEQLEALYRISHQLTFEMAQPIFLVWIDNHTRSLYLLAGYDYKIEFEVNPEGDLS